MAKFNATVMERCAKSGVLRAVQDIVGGLLRDRAAAAAGAAAFAAAATTSAAAAAAVAGLRVPNRQQHEHVAAGDHGHLQQQMPRQRAAAAAAVAAAAGRSRGPHHHGQQQQQQCTSPQQRHGQPKHSVSGHKRSPAAEGAVGEDAAEQVSKKSHKGPQLQQGTAEHHHRHQHHQHHERQPQQQLSAAGQQIAPQYQQPQQPQQQQEHPGHVMTAAATAGVPEGLGAGGLRAPVGLFQHSGQSAPSILQQFNPPALQAWFSDQLQSLKAAGMPDREAAVQLNGLLEQEFAALVERVLDEDDANYKWFWGPVETENHKVEGYSDIVKFPLCLGQVSDAYEASSYCVAVAEGQQQQEQHKLYSWESFYALAHDVQLIVANAHMFNDGRRGNDKIVKAADGLQAVFLKQWAKCKGEISQKVSVVAEHHRVQEHRHE